MPNKNIFFNSSMPRSGSTLLNNILNQNPLIHATPTDGVLELLFAARNNFTALPEFKAQDKDLMLNAWRGFCLGAIHGYAERLSDRPYICLKSRGYGYHIPWLKAFLNEDPKILCCVRDIRAVFCSMEKIYQHTCEYQSEIINHSQLKGTSIEKRIDIWSSSPPVGLSLDHFREMIRLKTIDKCHVVRYEDLAVSPDKELERIYSYLSLPNYKHDFNHVEQTTQEDDMAFGLSFDLHKIRPKVEPVEKDYVSILTRPVCDWLTNHYSWYQDAFNYR